MQVYQDQSTKATPQVLMVYAPGGDPLTMFRPWTFENYRQLCAEAMRDLDHWQPLDPGCTFEQYAGRFPFCGPPGTLPPLLRVEEVDESLHIRSHHYRRFVQEQGAASNFIEDLNTDRQAFAHGRYLHKDDGNSPEWRPCIVRPEGGGKRSFRVSWAFTPNLSPTWARESQEQSLDEGSVLLAPREPQITDNSVPEHQDMLADAQNLRAAGKSDHEIATSLNSLLEQKLQAGQAGTLSIERRPPPITANIVRNHLQKLSARQLTEAMGQSSVKR